MNRNKSLKLEALLKKSASARNNSKQMYIEYLQEYYCLTEIEKAIIERVINKSASHRTLKRAMAHLQNVKWLYQPDPDVKNKREKQEEEIRETYKKDNLFTAIYRWFNK